MKTTRILIAYKTSRRMFMFIYVSVTKSSLSQNFLFLCNNFLKLYLLYIKLTQLQHQYQLHYILTVYLWIKTVMLIAILLSWDTINTTTLRKDLSDSIIVVEDCSLASFHTLNNFSLTVFINDPRRHREGKRTAKRSSPF